MTEAMGHSTDVLFETQSDDGENSKTVCVPPDFGRHRHAFHKEVLIWFKVSKEIQKEVQLALSLLRLDQNHHLSQHDFWETNTLDDINLPSVQPFSDAKSVNLSRFDVHMTNQKSSERLINNSHPWKGIGKLKSSDSKRQKCQVQAEMVGKR